MPETLSPLASLVEHPRADLPPRAQVQPYGVVIHTTGSGVPTKAAAINAEPLRVALDYYLAPGSNCPHYVIDYDGGIHQVADELRKAAHAGIDLADRASYLSGSWIQRVSPAGLALWRSRWPDVKSPLGLFPGTSVNQAYLGVELIPLLDPAGRFTGEQYDSLARLLADVQSRHGISLTGSRLVGHEDLAPLTRWGSYGGWDPGSLRDDPRFSWPDVFSRLRPAAVG